MGKRTQGNGSTGVSPMKRPRGGIVITDVASMGNLSAGGTAKKPPALKLPQCASCGHQRTEKQGPLSKKEKTRGPWYCEDCQQCEECEIYKPMEGNFEDDGCWHYSKLCLTCEHPHCTHCPKYRHPHTKKAVQRRHKVKDQWFCKRTAACTKAHAAARKAANNKS